MVIHDYVNINTKPSWRKKGKAWIIKNREPLMLLSIVLIASLAGSV